MRSKTSTIRQMAGTPSTSKSSTGRHDEKNENTYIYRPGMIPPCRQMFYQVSMQTFKISHWFLILVTSKTVL